MDIMRVTAQWTGFQGAPGYSNFYFAGGGGLVSDAQQVADRVADAFSGMAGILPDGVTIKVQPEVEILDSDTGTVSGFQAITAPAGVAGIGAGGYSAASGAVVNWITGDVRFGRRIRGRTFIVPLVSSAYEDDGTLSSNGLAPLRAFADDLVGGDFDSEFGVWSRPRNGAGGVFATVTQSSVPDKVAVLRSRRD